MMVSSSTFFPHTGRVIGICAVCCMIYCMIRKHWSTPIIQGKLQPPHVWPYSSGGTLAPPLNSGANAAPVSMQALPVQCHYSAGTDVVAVTLE